MILDRSSLNLSENSHAIGDILESITAIGKESGVDFTPYSEFSLRLFDQLGSESQGAIIGAMKGYQSILANIEPDPFRINYESDLLKEACLKLNLKVPDDFISTVERQDICEIYLMDSRTQVYRNLEFLRYCSYDPCLMLLKKWEELFERDSLTNKILFERAEEVTLKSEGVEPWGIPNHTISERLSPERNEFKIILKNIAPCFHAESGERVGWASTIRVQPLGSYFRDKANVTPLR